MKIIKTSEALPKSGRYVLAWLQGAKIPMRAMWAAQHTLPLGDDEDPEWGEYSEEKDEYFCPAGWYEMNQHEEQHWGVDGNVVAWCELPRLDHQCLAQIEEPAQPVCWIRFCSDGSTEGPIMHSQICEARKTSGAWTPLYAGAAPAAVSPRGEYPHEQMDAMALDRYKVVPSNASMLWSHAVVAGDGTQQLYVGREVECQNMVRKFAGAFLDGAFAFHSTAAAPTAQAAPALEAPAAPAVPAGFALVPIEPTQQMLDAGRWSGAGSVSIQEEWARKEMWSRMLATITPPPAAYTDDLVALVENLAQALSAAAPDNDLAGHALNYLKRNGLQESPLRAAEAAPQAPAAPSADYARMYQNLADAMGYDSGKDGIEWSPEEWAAHLLAAYQAAPAAPAVDALQQEVERLRNLASTCYAGLGGECNLPERWLDVLDAASRGEEFTTDGLLPFLYVAPNKEAGAPAAPAVDAQGERDAAFEAVRQRLCRIPRWSFHIDSRGNLRRVDDARGNWIEFSAAHELFDPVAVDSALAAQAAAKGASES